MATKTVSKKLSRAELIQERSRLEIERQRIDAEIAAQSREDLQSLVDAFTMHLRENDFSLADALQLLGSKKARGKRGVAAPKVKGYEAGVTYKNPNGDQSWVGGTKGPKPRWLTDLLNSGSKFESLAVKK